MAIRDIRSFLPNNFFAGLDASVSLQAAANALGWGDQLYIPGGLPLVYSHPITFSGKVGIRIFGDGGTPGNNPYEPREAAFLTLLTGPGFNFVGTVGTRVESLVLSGSSDDRTAAPSLLHFQDPGSFGNTRNTVRGCYLMNAIDGVRIAEDGQLNGDTLLIENCAFFQCKNCWTNTNDQGMCSHMVRCTALKCVTALNLIKGGVMTIDGFEATACGDVCPPIAARPAPNAASDFLILLGSGGPNNELVTIEDFFIDGGNPTTSQFIATTGSGGYNVAVRDFHQCLTPGHGPLFKLTNCTATVSHSSIKNANCGTSAGVKYLP